MKFPSLTIWQKLSLVILIMSLPAAPLIYFFFESSNLEVHQAEQERAGLEYVAAIRQFTDALGAHRDATHVLLSGDLSFRDTAAETAPRVTRALEAVEQADLKSARGWGTSTRWAEIRSRWNQLQATRNPARDESYRRHTALIASALQIMRVVSDKSNLTTDPKLDTFYLIQASVNGVTPAIESLSQVRALGSGVIAAGAASSEGSAQLLYLSRQLAEKSSEIERAIHSIDGYNPGAAQRLTRVWQPARESGKAIADRIQRDLISPAPPASTARAFYEQATRALRDHAGLFDETSSIVQTLLRERIDSIERQRTAQLAVIFAVLVFAALLVLSITRGIAKQAVAISNLFHRIGSGDLNARAAVLSDDELGEIAKELNLMLDDILRLVESREEKEAIQRNIRKLLDEVSGVASGDLTRDAEVTGDMTGAIAASFNYMLTELRQVIATVQDTTAAVTGSAKDVQKTASQLAFGSQAQSKAIGHASSAIAEMARSIQQVSGSATLAAEIAQRAVHDAMGGATAVGKTIRSMSAIRSRVQETSKRIKRLGESSQEIGEIVRLIADIADRTGILALNASIQAATAGEAGKGFAVVAEEVERLSVRATESTRRISALIKSVQGDTTEAVRAMEETTREVVEGSELANEAGQRLRDIERISQEMASLIEQISQASREQAAGSEGVAQNVEGISQFTQQTASGAKLTEASTRHLAALANQLNESISRFKLPEGV